MIRLTERTATGAIWAIMKAKRKIGLKSTKKKKSMGIFPTVKHGGALPLLGILGSLVGGAVGVAKAVNKITKRRSVS